MLVINLSMFNEIFGDVRPSTKIIRMLRDIFHYSESVIGRLAFFYGIFRAIRIIDSLRRPPKFIPIAINTFRATREKVLNDLRRAGIKIFPSKIFPEVALIAVEGPFEIPDVGKKVVVKDKSAEEIMLGANLYAPGLLEMDPDISIGDEVNIVSRFGDLIAVGISRIESGEQAMKGAIVEVTKSKYRIPNLRTLRAFTLGEAYQIPLIVYEALTWFSPEKEERILCVSPNPEDLAFIMQRTEGEAEITIVSKTELEDEKIKMELRRLKLMEYLENAEWHISDYKYIHFDRGAFDAILVRPRSSKIGLRPRISAFLKERDFIALALDAKRLLEKLVPALDEGGRMIYLNPSIDPLEGEILISYLLQNYNLVIKSKEYKWGKPGIREIYGGEKALKSYPDIMEDIGFYAALLFRE